MPDAWQHGAAEIETQPSDCAAGRRVAIIDRNTRRQSALKAEIAAERTACRTINMPDPDDLIYNERTAAGAIGLDANCFEIFRHRDFIRAIRRQLSFGVARKNRQV